MPLTALYEDRTINSVACGEEFWSAIHGGRPRAVIRCRWCGQTMHAREHHLGLRHFAHDPKSSDCPTSKGETTIHMRLKIAIADAAREVGWIAEMEVLPDSTDDGGWRADVMAFEPLTNRRFAFEIQHSRMTTEEGRRRTANYERDGICVLWVATSVPTWIWRFPGILVDANHSIEMGESYLDSTVLGGVATLRHRKLMSTTEPGVIRSTWTEWEVLRGESLRYVITARLKGKLVSHNLTLSEKMRPWGRSSKAERHALTVALVTSEDIESETEFLRTQREEKIKAHSAGFPAGGISGPRSREVPGLRRRPFVPSSTHSHSPLLERQSRILPTIVSEARDFCRAGELVWIGLPPRQVHSGERLTSTMGSAELANGALLWLGETPEQVRPFAIICPVRQELSPDVGAIYRQRGFKVFVEGDYEAELIADALGWRIGEIEVRYPTL